MAATDVLPNIDFTKQIFQLNDFPIVNNQIEQKPKAIDLKPISKQEEIVSTPKYSFHEVETTRQIRIRSLSHWPHMLPSSESMSSAGWFSCNIKDRVICIYCNTLCHQWTPNDDPFEVHSRLAPQCPFVVSTSSKISSLKIINDKFDDKFQPIHPSMAEISRREATFSNITETDDLPEINELVRAGFFRAGVKNIVTCFYCNGSLHKWSRTDKPLIEHARWFPSCTYAKHLCGDRLYNAIQSSKKRMSKEKPIDKDEIQRLAASRLDLPIVRQLRQTYQLSIIKRCIEDQLKVKNDDFHSDSDLRMACLILQRQVEIINGCKDKLIIPSKSQKTEDLSNSLKKSFDECLICLTEEKQLACMPCGHLCACVTCGYALRSCPVCREKIQCFVRINL